MQYQGGKYRAAAWLVSELKVLGLSGPFWEPFCGGLGASVALAAAFGEGLHSDGNPALIALYQAVAAGWQPPGAVSEAEYAAARTLPDTDPRKAFCAVGCSFGGKWFGGYARDARSPRDFAGAARRALLRDVPRISIPFFQDFLSVDPFPGLGFLYCDPPYAGTTEYARTPKFDSITFWRCCEAWARHCPVVVSEYTAPSPWRCIAERRQNTGLGGGRGRATERLWSL